MKTKPIKDIKTNVEKVISFYCNQSGIRITEIWYSSEVGVVIRYSLDGTIKEMQIPISKDIAEIITPYQKKAGIVIKIETVPAIKLIVVLPPLSVPSMCLCSF